MNKRIIATTVATFLLGVLLPAFVFAVPLTSPNYKLDPQGINAVGGQGSSANYRMVSSGGEAVVGNGSGGSYKLSTGYVGALQQSIELRLLESGIAAYYPLDTNTGMRVYDATAGNNNGLITATTNWTSGKIAQGVNFPANSSYAEINDSADLDFSGDMTISFWARPTTSPSASTTFISKGHHNTGTNYQIRLISQDGPVRMVVQDDTAATNRTVTSNTTISSVGAWYHIVGMRRDNSLRIFINGVEESSSTAIGTNPSRTNNDPLWLGGIGTATGFSFIGDMDEVKFYNRALTNDEVSNLYDANMAGVTEALTIPQVVPGVTQTVGMDMVVVTDAGGYNAAISQNKNLTHTDSTTTISATNAGTVATPGLWDEGTTKGLGFTLMDGLNLDTNKWGTGPVNYKYAALPNTATTFYSRTGLSGGTKEVTKIQFKLDVPTSQKSGGYTNIATVTAVMKP